ncbi:TPA: hypothetical protein N0F65_011252, partial [Lagenidium giganteum]
ARKGQFLSHSPTTRSQESTSSSCGSLGCVSDCQMESPATATAKLAVDVTTLSRRALQHLAIELQLCRGNVKSDVIQQHVADYMQTHGDDGVQRVAQLVEDMPEHLRMRTPGASATPLRRKRDVEQSNVTPRAIDFAETTPLRRSTRKTPQRMMASFMRDAMAVPEASDNVTRAVDFNDEAVEATANTETVKVQESASNADNTDGVLPEPEEDANSVSPEPAQKKRPTTSLPECIESQPTPIETEAVASKHKIATKLWTEPSSDNGIAATGVAPSSIDDDSTTEVAATSSSEKLTTTSLSATNSSPHLQSAAKMSSPVVSTKENLDQIRGNQPAKKYTVGRSPFKVINQQPVPKLQSAQYAKAVKELVASNCDLAFTSNRRVRCLLTKHEMKADVATIQAHISGKRYLRIKSRKASFKQFEPMFTEHPDEAQKSHLLWCNVTDTVVPRDTARVEAHIRGVRYQKELPLWQEAPMEFAVPLHAEDLELPRANRYHVQHVQRLEDLPSDEVRQQLRALEDRVLGADDASALLEQDTLDLAYSLAKKLPLLSQALHGAVVDTFAKILLQYSRLARRVQAADTESHVDTRNAFTCAVFLLVTATLAVNRAQTIQVRIAILIEPLMHDLQKKQTVNVASTTKAIEKALSAVDSSLEDGTSSVWTMGMPNEEFWLLYSKLVVQLIENATISRHKILRASLCKILVAFLRRADSTRASATMSITELIISNEHAALWFVDFFKCHQETRLISSILCELGDVASGNAGKDAAGMKNVSVFLSSLTQNSPQLMVSELSFLLALMDSENYQLRIGAVGALSEILVWNTRLETDSTQTAGEGSEDTDLASHAIPRDARERLFNVMLARACDTNSFVRSHVMKSWLNMAESAAIPVHWVTSVAASVTDRLSDKAVLVRRNSIVLLSHLITSNPFMGCLDKETYIKKRDVAIEEAKECTKAAIECAQQALESQDPGDNNKSSTDVNNEREEQLDQELRAKQKVVDFYNDAIAFIETLINAVEVTTKLLSSKSSSDVVESMKFLERAAKFEVSGAKKVLRSSLRLIWRTDPAIQDQVLKSFCNVFVAQDDGHMSRSDAVEAAENLLKLMDECSAAESACVEQILRTLGSQDRISKSLSPVLWGFVEISTPPVVSSNALNLISMINYDCERFLLSGERLPHLCDVAFGELESDPEFRVFTAGCRLIKKLFERKSTGHSADRHRYQRSGKVSMESICCKIQTFLSLGDGCELGSRLPPSWFDSVQVAIDALFVCCARPGDALTAVIKRVSRMLALEQKQKTKCPVVFLAHLLFVVGHTAVRLAVHIEELGNCLKKSREVVASRQEHSASGDGNNTLEHELGVTAATEADEEQLIQDLINNQLIRKNLLSQFGPLIVGVLRGADFQVSNVLIDCASVALGKFMVVCEEFCKENLQLLFTMLKKSTQNSVRANLLVTMGDLAVRFPNLIEPWTAHLYARLRDNNVGVRKNAIVVLSHLVLNDMIKVKGQISDITISLVDEDANVRELASAFFIELSKRGGNQIYNLLPDIISRLSTSTLVSSELFEHIMKFLAQFITKDKHVESITDKLCQRFLAAESAKQKVDMAFCLAILPHSEKSLKSLLQARIMLREVAVDPKSLAHFGSLISKSRRANQMTNSTSIKDLINQLEEALNSAGSNEQEVWPPSNANLTILSNGTSDTSENSENSEAPKS